MEFQEVLRRRRMVRNYDPTRPVPEAVRDRLLANALRAPSAGFSQGWAFLVLDSAEDRTRFWTATTESLDDPDAWLRGMTTAPLLIVPLSHKRADRDEARWPVPYWDIDTGFAALLMLLTAVDEELGACFFGVPPERMDAFRTEFGVPEEFTPIGCVSVGYRAPDRRSPSLKRGHRPIEDVVHYGSW
jgi:nitroreductase